MVFGNIRDLKDYGYLEEEVLKCFEYAKTHDLLNFEKGSHEIEGDNLFVNIVEYKTTTPEERLLGSTSSVPGFASDVKRTRAD